MENDVHTNRSAWNWTRKELFLRLLWGLASPLFHLSPRHFWGWRVAMLRMFGAKIGSQVHIYSTVRVTVPWTLEIGDQAAVGDRAILYALGPISIGDRATVSQGAHLCAGTHDLRDPSRPLLKPPITIGNDAWICADAFVGPDVVVGDGAIVGARAVVMKDVSANAIVAGNPARPIGSTHP